MSRIKFMACLVVLCIALFPAMACTGPAMASPPVTSITATISPEEVPKDTPTDITVTVLDQDGDPVENANVWLYQANVALHPPSGAVQVSQGLTGTDGTYSVTDISLEYSGDIKLRAYVWIGSAIADAEADVVKESVALQLSHWMMYWIILIVVLLVFVGTMARFRKYTRGARKQFTEKTIAGFKKNFGNSNSKEPLMKPVASAQIFESWKRSLLEMEDVKLFISGGMLKSFKVVSTTVGYRGSLSAKELVEYHGFEDVKKRMDVPYQLHTNPKPSPPVEFKSAKQAFPLSEAVNACGTCKSAGKESCYTCKGQGQYTCGTCKGATHLQCKRCLGKGTYQCDSCGGLGWKNCQTCGGTGMGIARSTQRFEGNLVITETDRSCTACRGVGHFTCGHCAGGGTIVCRECGQTGKIPCSTCNAQGIIQCGTCDSSGEITCRECGGPGEMRHLHQEYWNYPIETLSKSFGTETPLIVEKTHIVNEGEFDQDGGIVFNGEPKGASPQPNHLLREARIAYKGWMGRSRGRVLLNSHTLSLIPVAIVNIEYRHGDRIETFPITAVGNETNWVLSATKTPVAMTARYAGRYSAFVALALLEVGILLYFTLCAFGILPWPF